MDKVRLVNASLGKKWAVTGRKRESVRSVF